MAGINTSLVLTCESEAGEPLSSCLWGRTINGQRQVVLVDPKVVQDGGKTGFDGISYAGNGLPLHDGKCSLKVESISEGDAGSWSCTLVSHNGTIFNGLVDVTTEGTYEKYILM